MKLRTVFLYLVGQSEAIREVATSKASIWLGLFFVLTAGIAREYDQVFITEAPLKFCLPLLASLIISLMLFTYVETAIVLRVNAQGCKIPRQGNYYRTFLALFWMTAPLAWLYAIPVERFLNSYDSAAANFVILGIISTWRVVLLARAIAVLTGMEFAKSLLLLLFPVSLMIAVASFLAGLGPALGKGMAGVEDSPEERLAGEVLGLAAFGGLMVLVLSLIGSLIYKGKVLIQSLPVATGTAPLPKFSMMLLAIFWIGMAIFPQLQTWRSYTLGQLWDKGDYTGALQFMSRHTTTAFAPARPFFPDPYGTRFPSQIHQVIIHLQGQEAAWVHELYLGKLAMLFKVERRYMFSEKDLMALPATLAKLPGGADWTARHLENIRDFLVKQGGYSLLYQKYEQMAKPSKLYTPVPWDSENKKGE